jgi:amino acid permease
MRSEAMLTRERFAYAILAADELVAVSNTIKFRYDDGRTFLNWKIGEDVDNAVWISVFLILAVTINMFPVKVRRAHFNFNEPFTSLNC